MKHVYVIGEIGLNHNGSIDIAKELIGIAHEAGCDAIKLQKREVDQMATADVLDSPFVKFPAFGKTYREMRENLELSKDEFLELKKYTTLRNMDFIVTPFDIQSLEFLDDIDIDSIKIASHSLTDLPLLEEIAKRNKPIILSTGMSTLNDIIEAKDTIDPKSERLYDCPNQVTFLHCVSQYPMIIKYANLLFIRTLKETLPDYRIGFSDHQNGISLGPVAVALGAEVLEKHFTLDRTMEGFDHAMSLEPYGLIKYVRDVRITEKALTTIPKTVMPNELSCFLSYRRTIVSTTDIKAGTMLRRDMLTTKAPNIGLKPNMINEIIGLKCNKDIPKDSHFMVDDIIWDTSF